MAVFLRACVFMDDSILVLDSCDIFIFLPVFVLSVHLAVFYRFFKRNSLVAHTHKTNTHTHTHLLSSSCPSYVRNQGFSLALVAGLRGAAGLPVDSHIRSYSLHRNTIIEGEGEAAPSVEY